jgi:nucleoid DNA-binding protein
MLAFGQMKKFDLAREIARRHGVATADAADQLDRTVTQMIRALRGGRPARLPGLGTILPGKPWTFQREQK